MRGWSDYFKHVVCKHMMETLETFVWRRVFHWLKKLHRRRWKDIRRHLTDHIARSRRPSAEGIELFNLAKVPIIRYRYRGNTIPNPWAQANPA